MNRIIKWIAILLVFAFFGAGLLNFLYLRMPEDYDKRLDAIASQAERGAARGHYPGVMWAVVTEGEVLASGAAGFADLASQTPMTPDTIMPIGSISKVFAGLAGAFAAEEGALDLNAPIADILSIPFDPPDGAPRSFAQLATHTAGIVDTDAGYEEVGYYYGDTKHPVSLASFLTRYLGAGEDLYSPENFGDWAPGEVYAYSNVGAGLAGLVIAYATGQAYDAYTRDKIIDPLGLSGFWGHKGPAAGTTPARATLYTRDDSGAFEAIAPYALATWPDGQFNASANDLAKLMAMYLGNGRLDGAQVIPASVVTMQKTPRVQSIPGKETEGDFIGLFWERETLEVGPIPLTFEGHSGGDPGVVTFMYQEPGSQTGFVMMFNGEPDGTLGLLSIVRLALLLAGMPQPA